MLRRLLFHSAVVHEGMYEMMTSFHVLPLENGCCSGEAPDAPFFGYRSGGGGEAGGEDGRPRKTLAMSGRTCAMRCLTAPRSLWPDHGPAGIYADSR